MIHEQGLLWMRTAAASCHIAADPVFMIPNLPHEFSAMAQSGGGARGELDSF